MKPLDAVRRALGLIWRVAPGEIRLLLILNLVYGAGPPLLLYVGKVVIDEVIRLAVGGEASGLASGSPLLLAVVAFVAITFGLDAVETLRGLAVDNLRDRTRGEGRRQLLTRVAGLEDLSVFEDAARLTVLHLAERGVESLWRLATAIGRTLVGVFAFAPAIVLTGGIAWWVPAVLFLSALPAVILQGRVEDLSWQVERSQADNARRMELHERLLLTEPYAKEIRLFGLQRLLLGRWNSLFQTTFGAMRAARARGMWVVLISSMVSAAGAAVPYVFVVAGALRGNFTPGDLAMYAGLIFQVRRSLELLVYEGGEAYQAALSVGPVFQVLDFEPRLSLQPLGATKPRGTAVGIRFAGVHFTYPGSERPAIDGVDLVIEPDTVTVIVGENGAGKTTLAKLLCRLYDPDSGAITWHGRDLRSFAAADLRSRIAVVVQDYAHFPVTARENIGFGDLSKLEDDSALLAAAGEVGLDRTLSALEHGWETPLGKMLEGGVDLSGGEWQRLAIARALLRRPSAQLVVMDEPTAAIDPLSEHELLDTLRSMARGRMALVVSHRLSLARMADQIVVLDRGRVAEQGSHDELLDQRGLYHAMFTRQASSYI